MYAIVKSGGKQYRVEPNGVIDVDLLDTETGKEFSLKDVLIVVDGENVKVGNPSIKGASVTCEVLDTVRGKKGLSFKFRRRESFRKRRGFRSTLTRLKVKEIIQG